MIRATTLSLIAAALPAVLLGACGKKTDTTTTNTSSTTSNTVTTAPAGTTTSLGAPAPGGTPLAYGGAPGGQGENVAAPGGPVTAGGDNPLLGNWQYAQGPDSCAATVAVQPTAITAVPKSGGAPQTFPISSYQPNGASVTVLTQAGETLPFQVIDQNSFKLYNCTYSRAG